MSYDVVALWLGQGLVHYKLSDTEMRDYVAAIHRSQGSGLTAAEEMGPDLAHTVCGGARCTLLRSAPGGLSEKDAWRVVRATFREYPSAIGRAELWSRATRAVDPATVFRGRSRLMIDF